jgi:hypothetical protein
VPTGLADGFGEGRLPTPNDPEIHPTLLGPPSPTTYAGVRPYSLNSIIHNRMSADKKERLPVCPSGARAPFGVSPLFATRLAGS